MPYPHVITVTFGVICFLLGVAFGWVMRNWDEPKKP
jgi:hypothetical protein